LSAPDQDLVLAIAAELGVDPSYVEKDWQAMRLVAAVAGVGYGEVRPVFAGGTSLSKAFGLIKRFSEDLDFRLALPEAGV
jgi:predicted nucleotidyltransferase component of viral defense system